MSPPERRRAERHATNLTGTLRLSEGRVIAVRIRNIGPVGALCEISDLESAVMESERAFLDHPNLAEGLPDVTGAPVSTPGSIVRVDLELVPEGVVRHIAMHFDGGAGPELTA